MSSIVTEVLGIGRQSIGLTGEYDGKTKTISIDITSAFTMTANADITEHGIEKDAKNPIPTITDHVRPKLPTISMEIIIADDLVEEIKAKEKMKVISFWQKTGSLIRLDGYGTGSNIPKAIKQAVDNFRSEMKEATPYNAFDVGIDTDVIPSLVIGNINWKKSIDTGPNIGASISLQRVYLATARIGTANSGKSSSGNSKVKNAGKTDPKTAANQSPTPKSKSILSGAAG